MRLDPQIFDRAAHVLGRWQDYAWTVQGFGMIRTYLDDAKRWRLNVWDDRLAVPDVSDIHDHPWDFTSFVMCGRIANFRFDDWGAKGEVCGPPSSLLFQHVLIETGEGGGPVGAVDEHYMTAHRAEVYLPGDTYTQKKDEIHRTMATRGTVTLNDRSPPTAEHTANIYWPSGPWVNAKPRPATQEEVYHAVAEAARQTQLLRLLAV